MQKLTGLTAQEVEQSRAKYGSNRLTEVQKDSLWKKILEGFKDPMIIILLVALGVQVVLYFLGQAEWFEPVGILIAILIANGVSAVSEYKQEGKATALKAEEEGKEMAKVIRDGRMQEIHVGDVVRGDIIFLQVGDKIPADGPIVEGTIKVDQSSLNGESEEANKTAAPEGAHYDIKDLVNEYYVYRGTVVCGGDAYMEAAEVGDSTLFGQLALEAQEEKRQTPLQVKLAHLAKQISMFGYIGSICIVAGILIRTLVTGDIPTDGFGWVRLIMNAITVAVTIIVCAVPEGLPMLTSILLSYQSLRMAKDNVLVRKINGLETAGSLSILFTDKTGTITDGHLSVVELTTGGVSSWSSMSDVSPSYQEYLINGIGVNNGAVVNDDEIFGGNSTDRALMQYLIDQHAAGSVDKEKIEDMTAFDSAKKYSTAIIRTGAEKKQLGYIKGAPEIILEKCRYYLDQEGARHELTSQTELTAFIDGQAARSMRLLAVAVSDSPEIGDDLTLIAILSIRDNVREQVIDAIREVQDAGIQVVMVTGDRRETAQAIARESGLIRSDTDIVITSKEMAEMSDEKLKEIMPRLRVVARALPTDKSRLVRIAQSLNLVVGMTGDGVNDAPALKIADVGFAMGSGTEVAKEAGDITILDDNFSSIEKAILYGRTMFKSIRKFLIFQLTVNVAAVLICFIGPLMGVNVVLTVIQLLLVNLAMDTLAAIAFGSEPALQEYMREKPIPRSEPIVTRQMFTAVLISAIYITIACLLVLFDPWFAQIFPADPAKPLVYLRSAVFALFMMAITFNGFNARTEHINPFEHLERNRNFLIVMLVIFLLQFVFVTFGGVALDVDPLNARTWLICILMAFLVIPIDMIRKAIVHRRG
ncbi:MAG: calcium-translocating P-type ATPase, PMCA-type [Clostridia bacterium]|nr:calcium-translocating P-type ATPase, PMCA-type [Clostridia bacterium]